MKSFWNNKKVFLTGHTGFKGTWLSLYLKHLGAEVSGYALSPTSEPSLFNLIGDKQIVRTSTIADIRNQEALEKALQNSNPDVIFHLAAQPLVRLSYQDPLGTIETNITGTANLLHACRNLDNLKAVVVVTTDKCYENREWHWPYRETDSLGGHDPYSASKACTEIITQSFTRSFFHPDDYLQHNTAIATARAGNVIGGGDWSEDRLIPDAIRTLQNGSSLEIRHPQAIRPWQHVLDPLNGYLLLARRLVEEGVEFNGPWNFGPAENQSETVEDILNQLNTQLDNRIEWHTSPETDHPHEAGLLKLDCSKARAILNWQPVLDLEQSMHYTADWYQRHLANEDSLDICMQQIQSFESEKPQ
jgi:CDP-glucose 4,6-dehydratase